MPTSDYITKRMEVLEERHRNYHDTCRHLRAFWDGKMWEDQEAMERSLTQIFRDLRHGGNLDRDPDVKVTLPIAEAVVTKFMAYLYAIPQVNVITPPEGYKGMRSEQKRRDLADQNEKFIYGTFENNDVEFHYMEQAWYLPLMGCCFVGSYPESKSANVCYITRSPEFAYPVWDSNHQALQEIGFKFEIPEEIVKADYPDADLGTPTRARRGETIRRNVEVIEWYDKNTKTVLVAGHVVEQVTHNLGFVPWVMPEFYHVPGQDFGKGIIEGNAQLFQKLNMLDSLELQAIIENVFAMLVLENPAMAPEDIDRSPGAILPLQQGGKAYWLAPPATTTDLTVAMARDVDFLQRGTHLPGSAYGEGVASSITTGKAQHESMLPTGNIIEYVQANIGRAWSRLIEQTFEMTEQLFPNDEITLFGRQFGEGFLGWIQGAKVFSITMRGSDLRGWSRHELVFQPQMNLHEKIVMGLQLAGGGLVSKKWQRNQIGIADDSAMKEEILSEMLEEGILAGLIQQMTQGAVDPFSIEQNWMALDKGATSGGVLPPAPAPLLPGAGQAAPGGPMPGPAGTGGLPPVAPVGGAGGTPPEVEPNPQGQFTLDQAIQDFQSVKKIKGSVFLVGEIVQNGSTDGPIEVSLTNAIDKATLVNGLPDTYAGQLSFHVSETIPEEPHVNVTPGAPAEHGGGHVVEHPDQVAASSGGGAEYSDMAALSNFQPPLASNLPAGGFQGTLRS